MRIFTDVRVLDGVVVCSKGNIRESEKYRTPCARGGRRCAEGNEERGAADRAAVFLSLCTNIWNRRSAKQVFKGPV